MAVQLGEEKAQGDLIDVCEMAGTNDGTRLFSVVPSERTGGNGHKWTFRKLLHFLYSS